MIFRLVLTLLTTVFLLPGPAHAGTEFDNAFRPIPEDITKTCNHYVNRARFKERGFNADFDAILADACQIAIQDMYVRFDTSPVVNRRAERFLSRLTEFKDTIITLNMERAFGNEFSPRSKPVGTMTEQWGMHRTRVRPVSRIGEYLIAREMGLTDLMQQWAFAGGVKVAKLH